MTTYADEYLFLWKNLLARDIINLPIFWRCHVLLCARRTADPFESLDHRVELLQGIQTCLFVRSNLKWQGFLKRTLKFYYFNIFCLLTVSHNVTWFYPPPNSFLFLSTDLPPSPAACLPPTFMPSPFFCNPLSLLGFMKYWWVLMTQLYLMQVTKAARSLWVEGHVMSTQHFTGSSPSLASLGSDYLHAVFWAVEGMI